MRESLPYQRRTVFVTGATGGIGRAVLDAFVKSGATVLFQYNEQRDNGERLSAQTGAHGFALDFESEWQAPAAQVDVLVNCAGVNRSGRDALATPVEEIRATMAINVEAPLRLMQAYVPGMVARGWGRVVNVNSLWGLTGARERLSYAVSKHALRALTVTSALELAGTGVTVNEVCPGAVETDMLREMGDAAVVRNRAPDLAEYLRGCARDVPTSRLIEASNVAAAILFLASEGASDIVGESLRVAGGLGH